VQISTWRLEAGSAGAQISLPIYRFGTPGARPKAYIQGGLHADEGPGMRAAVQLIEKLRQKDAAGLLKGEIILVPAANPLGLTQSLLGTPIGRFDLANGGNFNRAYPDLTGLVVDRLTGKLGSDQAENVETIRRALRAAVAEWSTIRPADRLKQQLLSCAVDADITATVLRRSTSILAHRSGPMPRIWRPASMLNWSSSPRFPAESHLTRPYPLPGGSCRKGSASTRQPFPYHRPAWRQRSNCVVRKMSARPWEKRMPKDCSTS